MLQTHDGEGSFPRGADYEVLNRNGVVGFDFNTLALEDRDLFFGSVDPYHNSLVFGFNYTGESWYTAVVYDFVACRFFQDERIPLTQDYAWSVDGASFVYTSVDPLRNRAYKVSLHRLGTHVSEDVVLYEERDARFNVAIFRSPSYIFVGSIESESTTEWRVLRADNPLAQPILLNERRQGWEIYPDEIPGGGLVLKVNDGGESPDFRLVYASSVTSKDWSKELLAHVAGRTLLDMHVVGSKVCVETVQNARMGIMVVETKDTAKSFAIPFEGSSPFSVALERNRYTASAVRFEVSSLVQPQSVIELDFETQRER